MPGEHSLFKIECYFGPNLEYETTSWFKSISEARRYAKEVCRDIYEDYEGTRGIMSREELLEEVAAEWGYPPTEEDIEDVLDDEVAGWTSYKVTHIPTTYYTDV